MTAAAVDGILTLQMGIAFDKPRSLSPEALVRDLRGSSHCSGMEILLWDKEITVEDRRSGEEISIKVEAARLELNGGKKEFAERLATALKAAGLRRRAPEGAKKDKDAEKDADAKPAKPKKK